MCMSSKAMVASSPAEGRIISDGTASMEEQGFADRFQRFGNQEVVNISPMETLKESADYAKLVESMDKAGQGDQNYALREKLRGQVTQDVDSMDPYLKQEMLKAGLQQAAMSGAGLGSDRAGAISSNIYGRNLMAQRQANQDQAMKFMAANPSERALPSGQELAGLKFLNRQNYADARNQKMQNMFNIDQSNMQGRQNRREQMGAALQEYEAKRSETINNVRGANQAAMGSMMGGLFGMGGSLGGAAMLRR